MTESENEHQAESSGKFRRLVKALREAKEMILLAVFFGGGAVAVINYFATREELDRVDCFAKVNVRMLQATANANFNEGKAKQGKSELRDKRRLAATLPDGPEKDTIAGEIEDLETQVKDFESNVVPEKKAAQRSLEVLTQHLCYQKDPRKKILDELAEGKF